MQDLGQVNYIVYELARTRRRNGWRSFYVILNPDGERVMLKHELYLNSGVQRICLLHSSVSHGKRRYRVSYFCSYKCCTHKQLCITYIHALHTSDTII